MIVIIIIIILLYYYIILISSIARAWFDILEGRVLLFQPFPEFDGTVEENLEEMKHLTVRFFHFISFGREQVE